MHRQRQVVGWRMHTSCGECAAYCLMVFDQATDLRVANNKHCHPHHVKHEPHTHETHTYEAEGIRNATHTNTNKLKRSQGKKEAQDSSRWQCDGGSSPAAQVSASQSVRSHKCELEQLTQVASCCHSDCWSS
jgi:hypothetical protein